MLNFEHDPFPKFLPRLGEDGVDVRDVFSDLSLKSSILGGKDVLHFREDNRLDPAMSLGFPSRTVTSPLNMPKMAGDKGTIPFMGSPDTEVATAIRTD
jgi:hypothetical protein